MVDLDIEKLGAEAFIVGIIFGNSNPNRKKLEQLKRDQYSAFCNLKDFIIKYLESNKDRSLPSFITQNFDLFGIHNEKNTSNTPKN